jgi:hypothetical protein
MGMSYHLDKLERADILIMNTDARSAKLAPEPVRHGGSTRGNGHRSALRGTPGNASVQQAGPRS